MWYDVADAIGIKMRTPSGGKAVKDCLGQLLAVPSSIVLDPIGGKAVKDCLGQALPAPIRRVMDPIGGKAANDCLGQALPAPSRMFGYIEVTAAG